jgi:dTDP-4-dehydrorhamnose 3,5-epimerase
MTISSHLGEAAPSEIDQVEGFSSARKLQSSTEANGALRITAIEGVAYRLTRPVSHDKGYLTEIYRTDWGITNFQVAQVTSTTTFPGQVRGWGLHQFTTDRLFAATGSFCIAVFDGRKSSRTFGCVNQFFLGGKNQGLVVIPPGLWHGWKNIGTDEATIISMPSDLYNHNDPDRWELAWDSAEAQKIIPYRWPGSEL